MVGCACAAGPSSRGLGLMRTLWMSWCIFLPLREMGMDFSQRLSGEGEVDHRHGPPGNAPCYLRRRKGDNDGLTLRRQTSTAPAGA